MKGSLVNQVSIYLSKHNQIEPTDAFADNVVMNELNTLMLPVLTIISRSYLY